MRDAGLRLLLLAVSTLLIACGGPDESASAPAATTPRATAAATPIPTDAPTPAPSPTPARTAGMAPPGTYLALGDSLAVGVGASRPEERGYVAAIHAALSRDDAAPALGPLSNLAVSGETSGSMIERGQLAEAISLVGTADPPVVLVTLDIGGNDLLRLLGTDACRADPRGDACLRLLALTLADFEENYRRILSDLTDALDVHAPGAPLAVMTYFNPFSGADPEYAAAGDLALLGADARLDCTASRLEDRGMNDIIRCVGEELGAVTVDVQPAFDGLGLELTHIAEEDIHANDPGYAVIAETFLAALREP